VRHRAVLSWLLLSGLALVLVSGCGETGLARCEVTGQVIFKSQPLDEGIIEFEPLDGQGSKSGALIKNGDYQIPKDKGLFPGRYKVTLIAGFGRSGGGNAGIEREASKGAARPAFVPGKERIPPEYNVKSNVVREVKKEGPNRFDFDIS
jgi:hypothetical protein